MVSPKKKGDRVEKEVADIFEKKGYLVLQAPRTFRPYFAKGKRYYTSMANDFYGLYDLIAKDKIDTIYIQVKSNVSHAYEYKPKIEEFMNKWGGFPDVFMIVTKVPRTGFVIFKITPSSNKWVPVFWDLKGEETKPFKYSNVK